MAANFWLSSQWTVWTPLARQVYLQEQPENSPNGPNIASSTSTGTSREPHSKDRAVLRFCRGSLRQLRLYFVEYIQRLGKRLALKQQVIATAIVFWKRFYLRNDFLDHAGELTAAAAILLASKVEECGVRPFRITEACEWLHSQAGFHEFPHTPADITDMELTMLEQLDYDLVVWHPYRTLLQLLCDARLGSVLQTCWNVVNDSYRTELCLTHSPFAVAVAAVYIACAYHGKACAGWLAALGIAEHEMPELIRPILELYDTYQAPAHTPIGHHGTSSSASTSSSSSSPALSSSLQFSQTTPGTPTSSNNPGNHADAHMSPATPSSSSASSSSASTTNSLLQTPTVSAASKIAGCREWLRVLGEARRRRQREQVRAEKYARAQQAHAQPRSQQSRLHAQPQPQSRSQPQTHEQFHTQRRRAAAAAVPASSASIARLKPLSGLSGHESSLTAETASMRTRLSQTRDGGVGRYHDHNNRNDYEQCISDGYGNHDDDDADSVDGGDNSRNTIRGLRRTSSGRVAGLLPKPRALVFGEIDVDAEEDHDYGDESGVMSRDDFDNANDADDADSVNYADAANADHKEGYSRRRYTRHHHSSYSYNSDSQDGDHHHPESRGYHHHDDSGVDRGRDGHHALPIPLPLPPIAQTPELGTMGRRSRVRYGGDDDDCDYDEQPPSSASSVSSSASAATSTGFGARGERKRVKQPHQPHQPQQQQHQQLHGNLQHYNRQPQPQSQSQAQSQPQPQHVIPLPIRGSEKSRPNHNRDGRHRDAQQLLPRPAQLRGAIVHDLDSMDESGRDEEDVADPNDPDLLGDDCDDSDSEAESAGGGGFAISFSPASSP